MKNDIYKRLARLEAEIAGQKAEYEETLRNAYANACEEQNEEEAAKLARAIRNKLLDNTDKQMSLDRLKLDISTADGFVLSLKDILGDDWAKYRQALRDLTKQDGFPFNVDFPISPDKQNGVSVLELSDMSVKAGHPDSEGMEQIKNELIEFLNGGN